MYRLDGSEIRLPPPRERMQDLELLIAHRLAYLADATRLPCPVVSPEAFVILAAYSWPSRRLWPRAAGSQGPRSCSSGPRKTVRRKIAELRIDLAQIRAECRRAARRARRRLAPETSSAT